MKLDRSSLTVAFAIVPLILIGGSIAKASESIALDQIGAEAQKQYSGEGVSITPTAGGSQLEASFQMLEGEVTDEGLWLSSKTGTEEKFRVVATTIGRATQPAPGKLTFATHGRVEVAEEVSRFIRPGLIEEYRVSVDGIRQDFLVASRPAGEGLLALKLDVEGARAEVAPFGAKLILNESGHEFAYSKLHVTDATGRVLEARMEVPADDQLRVVVDDLGAVYPVRVDPVFSQVNWLMLNTGIPGVNGIVRAIVVPEFSSEIYVGGDFTFAGKTTVSRVARWNGFQWESLGEQQFNGTVRALAFLNGSLIAGGDFTQYGNPFGGQLMNHVASWNGSNWQPLSGGTDDVVRALTVCDDQINPPYLCVGGDFAMASGVLDTSRIAKWDGSVWSPFGTGMDGPVRALAWNNNALYAGGSFTLASGVAGTANIAKWDGAAWSALGTGVDGAVNALAGYSPNSGTPLLFVGGDFQNAGGNPANYLAQWNDTSWSAVGSGSDLDGSVHALALFDTNNFGGPQIHVGGAFTTAGPPDTNRVATWTGSFWSNAGAGFALDGDVLALAVTEPDFANGDLYAGGAFKRANGVDVNSIVKSQFSSQWAALGSGLSSAVRAVAVNSLTNEVFVGGDFVFEENVGQKASHVARWNGGQWERLGEGVNGPVHALLIHSSDLYAGGTFDVAGFSPANNMAKWDGGQWSALGAGMNGTVRALAWSGTDLCAGGDFTSAGGTANVNRIAKWNGTAWSALGAGMDGEVSALTADGVNIYAGGDFATPATRIAKWDGSAWSALGAGMNQQVHVLALNGGDLFAGGDFTTPGNHIAKWDGSAWSALGAGLDGPVKAMAVNFNNLFVGGNFTIAGGISSNNIAKWNGSAWTPFSNMDGSVLALGTNSQYEIFAGGGFFYTQENIFVSDKFPSPFFARGILSQPNIVVTSSSAFETIALGTTGSEKTFTIGNTGGETLILGTIISDGPGAAEFILDASAAASTVDPGGTTSFTVTFAPAGLTSGTRAATGHIPTNQLSNNPFNVNLSAIGLSTTADVDTDGLNDWAEFGFAPLGFDWQVSQPELVSNLFSNLGNAQTNVNDSGFYSFEQIQALNLGPPLLEQSGPGQFKLTIGVEKSTTLDPASFLPFSLTAPGTTTNFVDGKLEFLFASPDDAAFLQLRAD